MKKRNKTNSSEDISSEENHIDKDSNKLKSLLELIHSEIALYDKNKLNYINIVLNKDDPMEITIQKINVYLPYAEFLRKLRKHVKF